MELVTLSNAYFQKGEATGACSPAHVQKGRNEGRRALPGGGGQRGAGAGRGEQGPNDGLADTGEGQRQSTDSSCRGRKMAEAKYLRDKWQEGV